MKYYEDYKAAARLMAEKSGVGISVSESSLVSFTPYIDNSCSARCRFCSERLTKNGMDSYCGEPCAEYGQRLLYALKLLEGKKVFLSLSGKEPTESPDMLKAICGGACSAIGAGLTVSDAVMYTNLSGFCKNADEIFDALGKIPLSHIEFSRHHYDETINQKIMNFRPGEQIKQNSVLESITKKASSCYPLRAVCVLQGAGVSDIPGIKEYISFVRSLGVKDVVFRELAVFGDSVDSGITADYIISNRIELWDILPGLEENGFTLCGIRQGYYYFSFNYSFGDMSVSFEMSDYEEMERQHSGSRLHKLILYPDGRICRSWNKKSVLEESNGRIL